MEWISESVNSCNDSSVCVCALLFLIFYFMCVYVICCAFYEPTIKISVSELIRSAGKRGEGKLINNKELNNRWHSFESQLIPKCEHYNDSHVKFFNKCHSQTWQGCAGVKMFF